MARRGRPPGSKNRLSPPQKAWLSNALREATNGGADVVRVLATLAQGESVVRKDGSLLTPDVRQTLDAIAEFFDRAVGRPQQSISAELDAGDASVSVTIDTSAASQNRAKLEAMIQARAEVIAGNLQRVKPLPDGRTPDGHGD